MLEPPDIRERQARDGRLRRTLPSYLSSYSHPGVRGSGQKERLATANYRAALYILLGANTLYFAIAETPGKALDAAAWLVLLVLFYVETPFGKRLSIKRRPSVLARGPVSLFAAGGPTTTMFRLRASTGIGPQSQSANGFGELADCFL